MPQTKNEIAKSLYKQGIRASATKVGEVAIALNLGDKLDYSDDEAAAIILDFQTKPESKPQQESQNLTDSQSQIPFDRASAKALVHQLQAETQDDQKSLIDQAMTSLDKAADARCRVLDMLSDRKAYLTDPVMFWAELEQLTAQKRLKPFKSAEPAAAEVEVLELADSFGTALQTWQYPQIAPASAMGALPY